MGSTLFKGQYFLKIFTVIIIYHHDITNADKNGLCPSSYPRQVVWNATGECYVVGSRGPCGRMAVISSDPAKPNFGVCRCKDYGSTNCFGRPLIQRGDRCYYSFSQGPCKKGQWFVRNKYGNTECQKTPCPIIESQRDLLLASEFPESDFYFTLSGSIKCYKTGTQGFCNTGERVYFLGTEQNPQCLDYNPFNCNAIPFYPKSGFSNNQEVPFLRSYGILYEGI